MTPDQFTATAQARGLPESASREALRLILVDGLSAADAARAVGCTYPAAYRALEKFRAWEAHVIAAGYHRPA
jgi:DNA-directed RNA polymerase specialized sigma24 family protein